MPIRTLDPHLRAGWELDTPIEDSLLRRFLVNWTLSIEAQGKPFNARTLRRDDLAAVDVGRPSVGGNVATLLAPLFSEDVGEIMAALDDFYDFASGERTGAVYLFSPWPSPDLRPSGWTLVDYQPLMLRPAGGELPAISARAAHRGGPAMRRACRRSRRAIVDGFPSCGIGGTRAGRGV